MTGKMLRVIVERVEEEEEARIDHRRRGWEDQLGQEVHRGSHLIKVVHKLAERGLLHLLI